MFVAPGPRLDHIPRPLLERVLALHPLLHLNQREAGLLTGLEDAEESAALLCRRTGRAVIVTLSSRGALVQEPGRAAELLPSEPVPMVDATGAGDSHAGAVLAGLEQGLELRQAVRRANRISAQAVQQKGGALTPESFRKAMDTL